jgi:hypothetical protein
MKRSENFPISVRKNWTRRFRTLGEGASPPLIFNNNTSELLWLLAGLPFVLSDSTLRTQFLFDSGP